MKRIAFLVLIVMLLVPVVAQAQSRPTFSSLEINLWPEYDRPGVLVIYNAILSSDVSLPTLVTLRIPAESGGPHAVAVGPTPGSVGDVKYTSQVSGDWLSISFTAVSPVIQFEYYDPTLQKEGEARHFEYHWQGDYAIQSLNLEVQQPLGASDMRISPDMGAGALLEDGMTYFHYEAGSLAAGDTFTLSFDYQKASDALSATSLQIQPSGPVSADTSGRWNIMQVLPWVLGGLGILLVVGGVVWYLQSGRQEAIAPVRRRRKSVPDTSADASPAEGVYCHQCGRRAMPGDNFCRSCGIRLRVE